MNSRADANLRFVKQCDTLSKVSRRDVSKECFECAPGADFSGVLRNARAECSDVSPKLRLALSGDFESAFAARQSRALLVTGLRDHRGRGTDAAICAAIWIASPRAARVSAEAFIAGIVALICACLVVPQHVHDVFGIRRLHEFIARSAAGFIAIGMLSACWCAWKGIRKNLLQARLFWTWSLLTLLPLAGIFLSECLLVLTRLHRAWVVPIRSALRNSVFWHLGFWEWSGSAAIFVFLCAAVFLIPAANGLGRSPQDHCNLCSEEMP